MTGKATRARIMAAATELFGVRGVDAVSLDEVAAAVGVRKQTVLYWFASKDDLVDAVFAAAIADLAVVVDAALRAAPDDPLARADSIVIAVFRAGVRTPAMLGLLRQLGRLPEERAAQLRVELQPYIDRAVRYLAAEMDAGRIRRSDPRLLAATVSAAVLGIASDPEMLRAVGWQPGVAELRRHARAARLVAAALQSR